MKEAMFWEEMGGGKVRCELCRHRCVIYEGKIGVCGVRINKGGKLLNETFLAIKNILFLTQRLCRGDAEKVVEVAFQQ